MKINNPTFALKPRNIHDRKKIQLIYHIKIKK